MKATGKIPAELRDMPQFPAHMKHVWAAFVDLHNGRGYSGAGPNPISYPDILAWDTLMRSGLQEWEVRAIKALDQTWMRVVGESSDG